MHVIATAGHVDHGKSTLVLALTGTDPDRWAEEKERGLTIDLGFAGATLPSGAGVAFVDVPGHVRFLKNMLAGVGAVDAALFVVAATEGWKPQSEEHLRILDLLGVGHGVVALTKAAQVDEARLDAVRAEVASRTAGTSLAGAEVVPVDVPAGLGVGALAAALDRLVARTPVATDRHRPRLWVDRSFPIRGAGTVATGTLAGGHLAVGQTVAVVGPGGGARRARVRGLESLGTTRTTIGPGHRVAVNLAGLGHTEVVRGDALVEPGRWHETTLVDATLQVLEGLGHAVSRRGAWLAYVGSGEHPVTVRVLGPDRIEPGSTGLVRLRLPHALALLPGDRFVLREAGRGETVGGGQILDVAPVGRASQARPDGSVARVVADRGWVDVDELERLTGQRWPATTGRWVVDPNLVVERRAAVEQALAATPGGLLPSELDPADQAALDTLLAGGRAVVRGGRATSAAQAGADAGPHPVLARLQAQPFSPPPPEPTERAPLRRLLEQDLVVESDGVWFATSAVEEAAQRVAALLADRPGDAGLTVGEVATALGTSRKWAVPMLGALDRRGVTRRRGPVRIAGPRLPGAGARSVAG